MKIFEKSTGWTNEWYGRQVNFIDENDVFVGYDTDQSSCEDAGYFIADKITPYSYEGMEREEWDTEGYFFDRNFFEEVSSPDLDEGGMVVFKLISGDKKPLFLHIYNSHTGYYGHGFIVKHGGETVKEGCL